MKIRVLFVDDDRSLLDRFVRLFRHDFEVMTADSAGKALELIKKNENIACMVVDLRMGEMNGIDFLYEIKRLKPFVSRIMLTGFPDMEAAVNAVNHGKILAFLQKPVKKEKLKKIIEEGISNYYYLKDLEDKSVKDSLTNLYNHNSIKEKLNHEVRRAGRYGFPLSVIMIDIDHFKNINDTYGHPFGDGVLIKIAGILKNNTRMVDSVGRYGGEEFLVILPEVEMEATYAVMQRIMEKMNLENWGEKDLAVTLSAGIAVYAGEDPETLIKLADEKLYLAKRNGRNRIEG
ncbi:MAG: diguanylate cyclase [Spirochaetales bacterium]|nr:diguanylate cyclase [Spirochaetales bacterium]